MMLRQAPFGAQFGAKGTAAGDGDGHLTLPAAVPAPGTSFVLTPQAPDGAGQQPDVRSDLRPAAERHVLTIALPASVALILKLITDAKGIEPDEAIARGICVYAGDVGIPTLARESAQDFDDVNRLAERAEFRSGGP